MTGALIATMLVSTLASGPEPQARGVAETREAIVYVGSNGSAYHGADCPRLRFGNAIPLADAQAAYKPCGVCHGHSLSTAGAQPTVAAAVAPATTARAMPAAAAAPAPSVAPSTPTAVAPDVPQRTTRKRSGRHPRRTGATIGFAVGFSLGYLVNEQDDTCFLGGTGCGPFFPSSAVGAVTGLIGAGIGALVGGHFGDRGDAGYAAAIETGRESVRLAAEARASPLTDPEPAVPGVGGGR